MFSDVCIQTEKNTVAMHGDCRKHCRITAPPPRPQPRLQQLVSLHTVYWLMFSDVCIPTEKTVAMHGDCRKHCRITLPPPPTPTSPTTIGQFVALFYLLFFYRARVLLLTPHLSPPPPSRGRACL